MELAGDLKFHPPCRLVFLDPKRELSARGEEWSPTSSPILVAAAYESGSRVQVGYAVEGEGLARIDV
jgi:hypothetical protein